MVGKEEKTIANYILSATLSVKDQMTARLRAAQKEAEKLTRGVGSLKDQDLMWKLRIDASGMEKLKRLREQAASMKFSPFKLRVQDEATPKVSKLRAELSSLTNKMNTVRVNVSTVGGEKLRGLKNSINEIASGALMASGAGVLGVAGIGFGAANMIENYRASEYQFARNKALFTTGMDAARAEEINQQLIATARKYGSTMIYTNAEVGKALEYTALAGWDADKAISGIPAILNAATASGEDLAMVSDILTDGLTAMQMKAGTFVKNGLGETVEASQHFADVLLRTTLRSNTNFNQLGYAMKYAAPLASALGYSIEDLAIAFGLMANNGIKADMAGTAMRGLLLRMSKAPKQAAEAMADLGIKNAMFDEHGQKRGLMATLMHVRGAMKGKDAEKIFDFVEAMTGEEIGERGEIADYLREEMAANGGKLTDQSLAKLAGQFSGTYALAGFLALMNSSDEDIQKLMTEIYQKSDGTGAEIAKEMMDTFHGDIKTLQSAWEDLNYEMFEGGASSGIRNFLQGLIADINAFKNSLKDGFDLSDVFGLVSNIITQLKNKFLELDGIGSILAGGILMTGMKKLYSQALSLRNGLKDLMKATAPSTLSAKTNPLSQVGTMNVQAGVVNVNGKIAGNVARSSNGRGAAPVTLAAAKQSADTKLLAAQAASVAGWKRVEGLFAAGASDKQLAQARLQARYADAQLLAARNQANKIAAQERSVLATQKYYAQKEQAAGLARADAAIAAAKAERLSAIRTNGAFAGIMTGLFGAMDFAAVKSQNQNRLTSFDEELSSIRKNYEELKAAGAPNEQLAATLSQIQEMENQRAEIIRENVQAEKESLGGAAGATLGSVAGAMLGSMIGPVGTMLGGIIGAAIGDYLGTKAAQHETPEHPTNPDVFGFNEKPPSVAEFRKADEAKPIETPRASVADFRRVSEEYSAGIAAQAKATEEQIERFKKIDAAHEKWTGTGFFKQPAQDAALEYYREQAAAMEERFKAGANLRPLEDLFFNKASAAELNEEQLLQQAQMESGFPPQAAENNFDEQLAAAQSFKESYSEIFSGMGEELTSIFDGLTEQFATFGDTLGENFSSIFDGLTEQFSTFGDTLGENFTSVFDGLTEQFATFGESLGENFTSVFDGLTEQFATFGEGISEGFTAAFENVGEIFSTFGEQINSGMQSAQAAVESSVSTMKSSFDSGLQSIQSSWGTLPGFFAGIFDGLGGVAASAGSAIYSGLTSVIGAVIGAWESAAATVSSIISSIGAAASAAVGSVSFGGIGSNYLGTSSWEGGLTTINEHGGEIIDLPSGTRIYPHATTLGLLKDEIKNRFDTAEPTFSNLPTLPPLNFSSPDFKSDSSSSTTNNSSNATFNFGGVNINSGMDFDEFADKLQRLLKMGQLNSARA